MIIKCSIVEDDEKDLQRIRSTLLRLPHKGKHDFRIDCFSSAEEIPIDTLYDLYFLDIKLPGDSGFSLANTLSQKHDEAVIIFITGYDDLVFDSFKLDPFYFVRKTFLEEDMTLAMRKYFRTISKKCGFYTVRSNDRTVTIPYSEILYFEVTHNTLYTHTSLKEYPERKTLTSLSEELPGDLFIQISQEYIVNASHIAEISGNRLVLDNGLSFTIPRRRQKMVNEAYALYLEEWNV